MLLDTNVKRDELEKKVAILEFLEKIGSHRPEYVKIEELYVEPKNYNEIKNTLGQYNIVFIVGDAEIGKTYTAIRLLWEYSKEYTPIYIPDDRKIEQWDFLRHRTDFEGKAIYLEDPWGRVEFESVGSLFKDIGTFILEVRKKKCKVIITSRGKVFKEFEKRKETVEDIWKFVNLLKVDLAYSEENLIEILNKYIQVFEPKWKNDKILRKTAFESVGKNLRTPMSIKKLIDSSKEIINLKDLKLTIEEASIETRITFAREIKEMFNRGNYDNITFLSLSYIGVNSKTAKSCYISVLKDLGYIMKGRNFNDLIKEFNEVEMTNTGLRFIHPSYSDAFGFALLDNGKPNNICINIFSHVLLNLCEESDVLYDVAKAVEGNFDKLPEKVRNELLIKLSKFNSEPESKKTIYYHNYMKMFENKNSLDVISRIMANNFDKLPVEVRNNLLLKLSKKQHAAEYVAWTIANNFNKLPDDIKNLLLIFLDNINYPENFEGNWRINNKVPIWSNSADEIKKKDIRAVAWAVENNFDKIPENMRDKLLPKLSKMEAASEYLARTIVNNFYEINIDIRNDILINLSKNHATAIYVHDAFNFCYDKLPTDVRNQLNLNLGHGGIALDNFDKNTNMGNDNYSKFRTQMKLLKLLENIWTYDPSKLTDAYKETAEMNLLLHNKNRI